MWPQQDHKKMWKRLYKTPLGRKTKTELIMTTRCLLFPVIKFGAIVNITIRRKRRLAWALGVWLTGWKWYSVMNHESALANEMMRDVLMKHTEMLPEEKKFHLWYGVSCQVTSSCAQPSVIRCTLKLWTLQIYRFSINRTFCRFGDDEVFFYDNYAFCDRANTVKVFLQERHVSSMTQPAKSQDVNSKWLKIDSRKKMVYDKASSCRYFRCCSRKLVHLDHLMH